MSKSIDTGLVPVFAEGGLPVLIGLVDRQSGMEISGGDPGLAPVLNGCQKTGWEDWEISGEKDARKFVIKHRKSGLVLGIRYAVDGRSLVAEMEMLGRGDGTVRQVGWPGHWLVRMEAVPGLTAYRERIDRRRSRRIKFTREDEHSPLEEELADSGEVRTMLACLYDQKTGVWLESNEEVMPLITFRWPRPIGDDRCGGMAIGPAPYQVECRGRERTNLRLRIIFSSDLNGDDQFDVNDYLLAQNRHLKSAPEVYRQRFWYKISCQDRERGIVSNLGEVEQVIRSIAMITDDEPQVPFLAGWKIRDFENRVMGMDIMGFGGMDGLEGDIGTLEELHTLHSRMSEVNAAVSYHINLDDSYQEYADWDESIICREPDGSMVEWINMHGRTGYHISHVKDVESRKVFKRLDQFLEKIPVREAIHLDAFRNTNLSWEKDGFIGYIDELEAGVRPILEYLDSKGLAPSLEGARQMPVQQTACANAFWHMSRVIDFLPRLVLFHGKVIGGGLLDCPERVRYALGTSINADICFRKSPHPLSLSIEEHWKAIVDVLYLGYFLYKYFLRHELLQASETAHTYRLRFSDNLCSEVAKDGSSMQVLHGGLMIAMDDDRFLPFDDAILIYSREGGPREFKLPGDWIDQPLNAFALSRSGREPFDGWRIIDGVMRITIPRGTPIRIVRDQ